MRIILDPHIAVVFTDTAQPVELSPQEALARLQTATTAASVALTDIAMADVVAPVAQLRQMLAEAPEGRLSLIDAFDADIAQGFYAARADVARLHAANARVVSTAYPVALRRGLEARGVRPDGHWLFLDVAGPKAWLSVWEDRRLLQWRQIPTATDLGVELARSLHHVHAADGRPGGALRAFTTRRELLDVFSAEGVQAELWESASPVAAGLDGVPADAQFWLPEVLHAQEERRLQRRRTVQRVGAALAFAAAVLVAGGSEWLRTTSEARVANAEIALQQLAYAREQALLKRGDHLRRRLNHGGLRTWAAALTHVGAADRPGLNATLDRGVWQVDLETVNFEAAHAFGRAVGTEIDIRPRPVQESFGWLAHTGIGDLGWIGWPSP
jgi:hypothetical protein